MGSKLEYAVNLLSTFPKNNHEAINTSDSVDFFNKRLLKENTDMAGLGKLQESMDRMLAQYNRESVRKTMLMHEEIFNEQVRELHRLYRVQKMLMAELRHKELKLHQLSNLTPREIRVAPNSVDTNNRSGLWSSRTSSSTNHSPFSNWHHPTTQTNYDYNFHQIHSIGADPTLQKRNSSCSEDTFRIHRSFDLKLPPEECFSADVSVVKNKLGPSSKRHLKDKMMSNEGSCDSQFCKDEEHEVELTLSIGFSISKKKSNKCQPQSNIKSGCSELIYNETRQLDQSMCIRSDREEECSEPINSMGSANTTFNWEKLPRPPWLFQTIGLNRT